MPKSWMTTFIPFSSIHSKVDIQLPVFLPSRESSLTTTSFTTLSDRDFIEKPKSRKVMDYLNKGWTIREIAKQLDVSTKTVLKVKKVSQKLEVL